MNASAWIAIERVLEPRTHALQRAAARRALAGACAAAGIKPFEPEEGPRGRPLAPPGAFVSFAHTRELAACALATAPIGVDLELADAPRLDKLERVLEPAELALLPSPSRIELARLWTAKEAVLKLAGVGLAGLSRCLAIACDDDGVELAFDGARFAARHRAFDRHLFAWTVDADDVEIAWIGCGETEPAIPLQ